MAKPSHWVWVVLWIALLGVSRAVQPDPEVKDVYSEFDDGVKSFLGQTKELLARIKRERDDAVRQLNEASARRKRESDDAVRQLNEASESLRRKSDDAARNIYPGLKKGPRVSLGPAEYMEDPGFQLEVLAVMQTCIDTIPAGTCSFETLQAFWRKLLVKGVHSTVRATALYATVVSNYAVAVSDNTIRSLDVEIAE